MANRPSLPACVPSGKMVAYGKGVAPTLNYQVPQKTSFTTYGDISLNLTADCFKVNAKAVPAEVAQYGTMTVAEIAAMLKSKNAFPTRNKPLVLKDLTAIDKSSVTTAYTSDTSPNTEGVPLSDGIQAFAAAPASAPTSVTAQDAYINKMAQILKDGNSIQVVDTFGDFDKEVIVTSA